jgi:hypothetical protein
MQRHGTSNYGQRHDTLWSECSAQYCVPDEATILSPNPRTVSVELMMTTVLLRHFPVLKPMLDSVKNPFAPWPKAKDGKALHRGGDFIMSATS